MIISCPTLAQPWLQKVEGDGATRLIHCKKRSLNKGSYAYGLCRVFFFIISSNGTYRLQLCFSTDNNKKWILFVWPRKFFILASRFCVSYLLRVQGNKNKKWDHFVYIGRMYILHQWTIPVWGLFTLVQICIPYLCFRLITPAEVSVDYIHPTLHQVWQLILQVQIVSNINVLEFSI